jgi:ATP-dependent protease ClpP protease subunit
VFCKRIYKQAVANEINIEGIIGVDVTVDSVRSQYEALGNPKEVTLKINSGGGDVDTGFAIYDYLKSLDVKVNTEVLGMCGSIATIIQQAVFNGGQRAIHPNSNDFIHNPYFPNEAPIPMEAKDALALHNALAKEEERILQFYVEHTGKDASILKAKMDEQTKLTATEAKELGFVDTILNKEVFSLKSYKVVAFYNIKENKNIMASIEETLRAAFDGFKSDIKAMIKPTIKNEVKETSEGVKIYYTGSLEVGTKVFADEAMATPAPDGVHTVDGKKYTVAGGEVTAVEEEVQAKTDLEIANEKIAELTAALSAKDIEVTNKVSEAVTAKETELETKFQNRINEFQAKFFTGDKLNDNIVQVFKNEGGEKPKDWKEGVLELRKKREAAKTQK